MTDQDASLSAAVAGTFSLGGDLLVNRLGFGAMRLTGRGILGEPDDPDEARRVLRRTVELAVNLIDTADSYGPEVSERLIAEALHPYPDDLVVDGCPTVAPSTCARRARAACVGSRWSALTSTSCMRPIPR